MNDSQTRQLAYLVQRHNGSWDEVFKLFPGQIVTIGRNPNNRIVLQDAMCSRDHCEVLFDSERWVVRDLQSRNGTLVNEEPVKYESAIKSGERIKIGASDFYFVNNLEELHDLHPDDGLSDDTAADRDVYDPDGSTHNRVNRSVEVLAREARDDFAARASARSGAEQLAEDMARLFSLSMKMGQVRSIHDLCELILDGLVSATSCDIGAVLLFQDPDSPNAENMNLVAYHALHDGSPYQRVSTQLTELVLEGRDAILALDVESDDRFVARNSLNQIQARSVICVPVCSEAEVLGLIHLYSRNPDNQLNEDDLAYAHAVAMQTATSLKHLTSVESLQVEIARAEEERDRLKAEYDITTELVGDSDSMNGLKGRIRQIAPTDATVLVRGPSGAGKELVARAMHESSPRRDNGFVTMNCAALSETLLESELFGHEKGSFTGATERKFGKFEQADKGTIFLDEVGEMGATIQAKFLRVLEGHPFERVGGREQVNVNVRVVAATNRDLEKMVEEGKFRADLYYRLNVVQIMIDPLRKRRSDIPLLAEFFLDRIARKLGRRPLKIDPSALDLMMKYDWPGNVRELQNTMERTVILCQNPSVQETDIQFSPIVSKGDSIPELDVPEPRGPQAYRELTIRDLEQEHILATLEFTEWNKSKAAQILGIERSTLDRKLARYKVSRPEHAAR